MALQPRSGTHQAYAQIRRYPVSMRKEGHLILSNIHSNNKKVYIRGKASGRFEHFYHRELLLLEINENACALL